MNTFKHKSLYAAIAGLGALGATGVAQAVSVNHDGLGQALIYPYYTVRSTNPDPVVTGAPDFAYNSLLSVVNSTASAKAVKVRFLEGRNSREVLDFNLYLSAKDVWTAAIIPTTDGAAIFTEDKSCTNPRVSSSSLIPTPFLRFGYTGSNDDKAGSTLDRTREGYVEIIEMGNVIGPTAVAVTHTGTPWQPPAWPACNLPTAQADTIAGTGGLFGSMTLINVLRGEDFGIDPVALDGFSSTALWAPPGDINPNLAKVNPKTSVVVAGSNVFITDWSTSTNTVDPVSAVLMHNNVYNEFVLAKETNSGTDWVVNFPTKNYYYSSTGVVQKLFQNNFTATGACDDVSIVQYDREERTVISETSFSPPPPTQTDSLCWETNVITFNGTNVLGSKNVSTLPTGFSAGWVALNFNASTVPPGRHQLIGGASTVFNTKTGTTIGLLSTTFNGLPVVGFAAITFENGTLSVGPLGALVQSNYGGNFNHKTTSDVK
jgi:hypothetical protein